MLIMFPKYKYYADKSDVKKAEIDKIIADTVNDWVKVKPRVFIEDELAFNCIKDKEPITCTNKRDIGIVNKTELYGEYTVTLSMLFNRVENISVELEEFKTAPLSLIKESQDKFYKKALEFCKERSANSVKYQSKRERVVIVFVGNKQSKNYFTPEPEENDGLLYIKVNIDTGAKEFYYSGFWISEENARKVLGAIYDE